MGQLAILVSARVWEIRQISGKIQGGAGSGIEYQTQIMFVWLGSALASGFRQGSGTWRDLPDGAHRG
jgi:hypothetical protein